MRNLPGFPFFGSVKEDWKQHLLSQDLIYVGGGNTRSMLALWREWGVDEVLLDAYDQGIILSGNSAGSICWFEQGITDSVAPLGVIDCMGLIQGSCCPHYDMEAEHRPAFLEKAQSKEALPGIALEDNTAAHYINGELKQIVTEVSGKRAFWLDAAREKEMDVYDLCSVD
ncbi:Type 1 glutamine amidotransferase-like domain-containing protein [Piscirickettsia litoralis]|uniref:Type 1 glutamine amidotransferase-like domain-containing protein n=1 Tax=Piscirickettsia litoralis TaxID=1891921 RepID=UPI000B2DACDC|nr:peptidase E [Piscirickettsia litoralis]